MQILTKEIIQAAIAGFEGQKQRIDEQLAELRGMLNGGSARAATEPKSNQKRKFSASALERMREAQQRRWAKVRGESVSAMPAEKKSAKPKRKMSAAGRKAIAEAQKKRWAAQRAAAKKAA